MSEPMISIEKIRQPLTAILGRLDRALSDQALEESLGGQTSVMTEDLVAARNAALDLKRMCDEAEKQDRKS